jgi:hypothetical protein
VSGHAANSHTSLTYNDTAKCTPECRRTLVKGVHVAQPALKLAYVFILLWCCAHAHSHDQAWMRCRVFENGYNTGVTTVRCSRLPCAWWLDAGKGADRGVGEGSGRSAAMGGSVAFNTGGRVAVPEFFIPPLGALTVISCARERRHERARDVLLHTEHHVVDP